MSLPNATVVRNACKRRTSTLVPSLPPRWTTRRYCDRRTALRTQPDVRQQLLAAAREQVLVTVQHQPRTSHVLVRLGDCTGCQWEITLIGLYEDADLERMTRPACVL